MDIVVIFNGLGNQMSQYAFYLAKKKIIRIAMLYLILNQLMYIMGQN